MNIRLLALPLLLAVVPFSAAAQNVLVPSAPAADAPKPAPQAAPTPKPVTPAPTPKPFSLSDLLGDHAPAPAAPNPADRSYISPEQQKTMIQNEMQLLAQLQQGVATIQNTTQPAEISAAAEARTPQDRDSLARMQTLDQQSLAPLYAMIQKSQQRLAILQAGPLKATDLVKLYRDM